jgi:DNA-binding MurR/RpiR family transcriptional regulator
MPDGDHRHPSSLEELRHQPPFSLIWQRLDSFPRQQRHFAQLLLQAPELVVFGSIRDVAKRAGVNIATISRFAAALGFDGYRAFQTAFRLAYLQRAGMGQIATNTGAALRSPSEAVAFARAQQIVNMEAALEYLSRVDLDGIASLLTRARRIVIMAEGAAVSLGLMLSKYLNQLAIYSDVVSSEIEAAIALRRSSGEDVFVVLSNAVTFRASVAMSELAQRHGAKVIAIVGNPISPLLMHADFEIIAPAQSPTMLYSVFAVVGVIELLVSHVAGQRDMDVAGERRALFDMYLDEKLLAPLEEQPGGSRSSSSAHPGGEE